MMVLFYFGLNNYYNSIWKFDSGICCVNFGNLIMVSCLSRSKNCLNFFIFFYFLFFIFCILNTLLKMGLKSKVPLQKKKTVKPISPQFFFFFFSIMDQ